jgi:hypothetical protein
VSNPTLEQLWEKRGQFLTAGGSFVEKDPSDEELFLIMAGPWPNRNIGARLTRCHYCNMFVGISPKGWELHRRNPRRDILCCDCYVMVDEMLKHVLATAGTNPSA